MSFDYQRSLFWMRRDLRFYDNAALFHACKKSQFVLAGFVFDKNILTALKNKKDARVEFIFQSLKVLDKKLQTQGSRLFIMYGKPEKTIPDLCKKLKLSAVFTNEDYETYAKKRDASVKKALATLSVDFHSFKDHVIFSGTEIQKKDGTAYCKFTPYKKVWLKKLKTQPVKTYKTSLRKKWLPYNSFKKEWKPWKLENMGFQSVKLPLKAGENQARQALKKFSKKINQYHKFKDYPRRKGTSRLSVHLRFGTLSIRECVLLALQNQQKGAEGWLAELIWRDFYQMILDRFPHVEQKAFVKKYQKIKWPNSKKFFTAWCKGQTGYPLVDAAMRELNQTGWMPNRLRMVTASFLTKDLLVDWRKGESWFAEKLLDFDKAANNGGWQWCASTGCDAQPYFRIFNPTRQSLLFDPEGYYIKKWIPELRKLNKVSIHFPQAATPQSLPKNFKLGRDYPCPIVKHEIQKQKILKLFLKIRKI